MLTIPQGINLNPRLFSSIAFMLVFSLLSLASSAVAYTIQPVKGNTNTIAAILDNTTLGVTVTNNFFFDAEGDTESGTTYQWQMDRKNITAPTENVNSLHPGLGNSNQFRFGITPKSQMGNESISVAIAFINVPKFTKIITQQNPTDGTFTLDAGFPTTAFTGATFTLHTNTSPSDYTWSANDPAVTVDGMGVVTINRKPSGAVAITATPNSGGSSVDYTFTVGKWFINNGHTQITWSDASNWCTKNGLALPVVDDLSNGPYVRRVGNLWSEWGAIGNYPSSGFISSAYWTSKVNGSGYHYSVYLHNGYVTSSFDSNYYGYVVCL